MRYSLRLALQSLWHEKWINTISTLSIAMGLLLIAGIAIALYNTSLFAKRLPERFSIIAYLVDNLSEQEIQDITASIRQYKEVENLRYISKTDALRELKAYLKDADYILGGLDENPLPASVEIRMKKEKVEPDSVTRLVAEIKGTKGIEDVQYGEKFLLSLRSFKAGMETVGIIVAATMAVGIIFICYSTVKILFYRRKDEIETLKLLGATRGFIRLPFVMEGGTIGLIGGIISLIMMFIIHYGVVYKLGLAIPMIAAIAFPPEILLSLPLAGLFLGISGALIAMGRIRFQ